MDPAALLEKHNPLLVMLPEDRTRKRPGAVFEGRGRGDYHPCHADFFLSDLIWRAKPKGWFSGYLALLPFTGPEAGPAGIDRLRSLVASAGPYDTEAWELDVSGLSSQQFWHAWKAYWDIRDTAPAEIPRTPYVYPRFVDTGPAPVLQYWYLYMYNDAANHHEGDWEMVSIELDGEGLPARAGYSGHEGGFLRPWHRVEKVGDRPVVYVARGSHASYFYHDPKGHRTNSFAFPKGLPPLLASLHRSFIFLIMRILPFRDHTATYPDDTREPAKSRGTWVDPQVEILPELDDIATQPDGNRWWMRLCGKWGSSHFRWIGTIGPPPPWEQKEKWDEPNAWIDRCVDD
jgi:hypothetical protein